LLLACVLGEQPAAMRNEWQQTGTCECLSGDLRTFIRVPNDPCCACVHWQCARIVTSACIEQSLFYIDVHHLAFMSRLSSAEYRAAHLDDAGLAHGVEAAVWVIPCSNRRKRDQTPVAGAGDSPHTQATPACTSRYVCNLHAIGDCDKIRRCCAGGAEGGWRTRSEAAARTNGWGPWDELQWPCGADCHPRVCGMLAVGPASLSQVARS
jgi:hypothetical protein